MLFEPLLGEFGKIPVLIRDDDTNFFTKPSMLESIYSMAWEKGLKTSFAVVPMQKGTDNISVPPEKRSSESFFAIADNQELIKYLIPKVRGGTAEILQHGLYHFVDNSGHWEFGHNLNKKQDIQLGRKVLTQAFATQPKFFVPPGEDITRINLQAVIESGLVPICRRTSYDTFLASPYLPNYIKGVATKFIAAKYKDTYKSEKNVMQFLKPVNMKISENLISWTTPLISSKISDAESIFNYTDDVLRACYSNRLPVCILNHYHLFYYDWNSTITRKELFQCWTQLVEKFCNLESVWFTTFSELHERSILIKNIQIAETGSKIVIESKVKMKNFSLRTTHPIEPNSSAKYDKDTNILTLEELVPNHKIILYEKN